MPSFLTNKSQGSRPIFAILSFVSLIIFVFAPIAVPQDPIRVETHQVLVPASVGDKNRIARLDQKSSNISLPEYRRRVNDVYIRDLTAHDFHLFEDGVEQRIQNVTSEQPLGGDVRDSAGIHAERIGEGGGRWSSPDRMSTSDFAVASFQYVIAYSPPDSALGSCHQIQVTVNRPNALVYARREYCNTEHAASDALKGTKFGQQLQSEMDSTEAGKLKLSLDAAVFHPSVEGARVYIAIEFPWQSLKYEWKNKILHATIGILGMVYKTDGTLAARFSDSGCCDVQAAELDYRLKELNMPTRYETQMELPRGEYNLWVVLSDGTEFGLARKPLTVSSYDGKQLSISEIAICSRIREASPASPEGTVKVSRNYAPLATNGYEVTPTANTRLQKGEPLRVYFEVYEPQLAGQPAAKVEAHLRIVDLQAVEQKSTLTVSAAPYMKAGSPVIPIGREIDISKLPDGSYRLEVEASDSAGKTTGWRGANFTVETVEQIRLK
jgi:hypothetical protein